MLTANPFGLQVLQHVLATTTALDEAGVAHGNVHPFNMWVRKDLTVLMAGVGDTILHDRAPPAEIPEGELLDRGS